MREIFIVAKRRKTVDSFFFFFFVRNASRILPEPLLYSPLIKFTSLLFQLKEYFHFHFYFIVGKYAAASIIDY